jgi:hypothetical protein
MADKPPAKKTAAKKKAAKKESPEKSPAKKAAPKAAAKKATPAKKAVPERAPTKQAAAKKTPAKEAAAKTKAKQARTESGAAAEIEDLAAHDHDHEHDEVDEEQAQADVARMASAAAALDDNVLRDALVAMSEKSRQDVAAQLQMPRATMYLGDALVPLLRRKLVAAGAEHQLQVIFALAERANDETIMALGDRSDDPSREDLLEVLPPVIDRYGAPIVTAMLAGYAASNAKVRPVARDLLDTDERFTIGPPIAVEEKASTLFAPPKAVDSAELEAKREQRRAAKDAKRAAQQREKEARASGQAARLAALHKSKRKH